VSEHKRVVERYFDGFRRGDHELILGCLLGSGQARRRDGVDFRFAYADVFTFTGDAISRVESYLVPLAED
jgi:ketosteroid isomerase-like protein